MPLPECIWSPVTGNLDKVEECKSDAADTHEFNLWTAPDCAGTEYETTNRTWFYFSVATPHNFSGKTLRCDLQECYKTNS